ncbi:MAG: hypothetical protein U9O41_02905, partial [Candidatus Aerophobetes bacterium]|nr:hypothetical protein [Candidatus Aerophobetes bacterium]
MNEEEKVNVEDKVMGKIRDEHITPRSRYVFVARKLGLGGGFALSLVLATLFINVTLFYLRSSGNLEFLSMGKVGLLAFLESFPYEWMIAAIAFFILASLLVTRYDISYRRSFKLLISFLLVLVIGGSAILAVSGVNKKLEEKAAESKMPVLQFVYREKRGMWRHGLLGEILQIKNDTFVIQTPQKQEVIINFSDKRQLSSLPDLKVGDVVRVAGKRQENSFRAVAIR